MTDEKHDTEEDDSLEDDQTERVFELAEAPIPKMCERCKLNRPRSILIKKIVDADMQVAFVCRSCSTLLKRQGEELARRLRETIEANGGSLVDG